MKQGGASLNGLVARCSSVEDLSKREGVGTRSANAALFGTICGSMLLGHGEDKAPDKTTATVRFVSSRLRMCRYSAHGLPGHVPASSVKPFSETAISPGVRQVAFAAARGRTGRRRVCRVCDERRQR